VVTLGLFPQHVKADHILEAIEASGDGLSKYQIRRLFHGHVEAHRIDAALETLVAFGALASTARPRQVDLLPAGRPSLRPNTKKMGR